MGTHQRRIQTIIKPNPVVEGAGVRLQRSIGGDALNYLDPFLLFDHFGSPHAEDYQAGFPMHPHRGIETVTYMLTGEVQHRDTLGNSGRIGPGDVQWMTAGGGILHEEMPQVRPEGNAGFQLWVNLPARLKMTEPRYQDIASSDIPEVKSNEGTKIRVIAGNVQGIDGPVKGIAADPTYLDVSLSSQGLFTHTISQGHSALAYVFEGTGTFGENQYGAQEAVSHPSLVVWEDGDYITVYTKNEGVRFLLISARPLNEPIARYGPFVMNTKKEIEQALVDLKQGTFIWSGEGV